MDKDAAAAALARELGADLLLLLTDVAGVFTGFGTPDAELIRQADPDRLRALTLPPGSMGPKVAAACSFVGGGGRAAIGELSTAGDLVAGTAGTQIVCRSDVPSRAGRTTLPERSCPACDGGRETEGGVKDDSIAAPSVR